MITWRVLFGLAAVLGCLGGAAAKVGSIFDEDFQKKFDILDVNDKRDYTTTEVEALEYLREYNQSRSFLAILVPPECEFDEWMYPSCCTTIEIMDMPHEVCIDMALEWEDLKIGLALNHNGEVLFSFEFILGEICVGIPFLSKIGLCGHLYHLEIKTQPIFLRSCLSVKIAGFLELRFYCLDAKQLKAGPLLDQQWSLLRSFQHVPENEGMIAVLIKEDKVVVEFNSPIPKEVVEAMKKCMDMAVEKIKETVIVVKKAVEEAWNTVAKAVTTAASNAWRWCKKVFG